MRRYIFIIAISFYCNFSDSQSRMIITVDRTQDNILGYTMDPDASGNKQSISLFGPILNLTSVFQHSYYAGTPISLVQVNITDSNPADSITLKITDLTVYAIKSYQSTYTNGSFNISAGANLNTELKCKFKSMVVYQNSSNKTLEKDLPNSMIGSKTAQMWEIKPDSTLTGMGGSIMMQVPINLGGRTHMEFYEAGDTKNRLASWFGNNSANLPIGLYDVVVDGRYTIKNVPVEQGKQTRLKMGVLDVSGYGSCEIENSSHQKFTYAPPFAILLPEGTYNINRNKKFSIEIKDGQATKL